MMQLLRYPDPFLKKLCREITDEEFMVGAADGHNFDEMISDMTHIMRRHHGVGLSAPQVGIGLRMWILEWKNGPQPVFNPTLLEPDGVDLEAEGCLSIPNVHGKVERARSLKIHGRNSKGEEISLEVEGMAARIAQHETDHLDGILFIDHFDWSGPKESLIKGLGLDPNSDPIAEFVKIRRRLAWKMGGDNIILGINPLYLTLETGDKKVSINLEGKRDSKSESRKKRKENNRRK